MFLMTAMDKLDEQKKTNETEFGSVLVFLPGIREIEDVGKLLEEKQNNSERRWVLVLSISKKIYWKSNRFKHYSLSR